MSPFIDVWPFNASSDATFAAVYFGLSVLFLGVARLIMGTLGDRAPRPGSVGRGGGPTPVALKPGLLPRPADALALAQLRGGILAVAETLTARAEANGWLMRDGDAWRVLPDARPGSPMERAFHTALLKAGALLIKNERVDAAAWDCAFRDRGSLLGQLERAGLVANASTWMLRLVIAGATLTLLIGAGALRIMSHGADGGAGGVAVALVLLGVCAAVPALTLAHDKRTPLGRATLASLEADTAALVEDVQRGRARDVDSVSLAVALRGRFALPLHDQPAPR